MLVASSQVLAQDAGVRGRAGDPNAAAVEMC